MIYRIILPFTLENMPIFGDIFDVTMCDEKKAKFFYISEGEFKSMNIDDICLDLFIKYQWLLGDGDYYFLNYEECRVLKEYLVSNTNNVKNQISSYIYNNLIEFCDEAIKFKTGIGFDF